MKLNQRGVAFVEGLIVLIVLGAIGFIGFRMYNANKDKAPTASTQTAKTEAKKAEPTWQKGAMAVTGTYADSSVVQVNDTTWRMYYGIQPEVAGNQLEVYSSTSTDGKTWTQDPGVRKKFATFPNVIKLADGHFRMYYQGGGVLKSAISTDGLTFTEELGTRVDKTNAEGLALDNVAAPTVFLQDDGTFVMVYRGTINTRYAADTPNPTTQLLLWATSTDGLAFSKKGIAVDTRNDTLNGQLDGPDLVKWDDGKLRVYATTYTGIFQFDFNGTTFSKGSKAYTTSESLSASNKPTAQPVTPTAPGSTPAQPASPAQVPGDPSLAKIGGTWFMYYGQKDGIEYASLR